MNSINTNHFTAEDSQLVTIQQELKTEPLFLSNPQKINKFSCSRMTVIDFSNDDLEVPVDVCLVLVVAVKMIVFLYAMILIFNADLDQVGQLRDESVKNNKPLEYNDIDGDTPALLSHHLLATSIRNEENLYTDYIGKINKYLNNQGESDEDVKNVTYDSNLKINSKPGQE